MRVSKLEKEMNTESLTWIFASDYGIIHVMYLIFVQEVNFGDKVLTI